VRWLQIQLLCLFVFELLVEQFHSLLATRYFTHLLLHLLVAVMLIMRLVVRLIVSCHRRAWLNPVRRRRELLCRDEASFVIARRQDHWVHDQRRVVARHCRGWTPSHDLTTRARLLTLLQNAWLGTERH